MPGIFISYRREDCPGHAGRIYDRLRSRFGSDVVFMDVTAIEAGVDFVDVLQKAVGSCDALLAVIGPQWFSATHDGKRRIDDPNDFVRIEIASALERNVRVLPVLVVGSSVPSTESLPTDLRALTRRQAIELRDARWDDDIERLVEGLEKFLKPGSALREPLTPRGEARPATTPTAGANRVSAKTLTGRRMAIGAVAALTLVVAATSAWLGGLLPGSVSRGPLPTSEIEPVVRRILVDTLSLAPDEGDVGLELAQAFHDRLAAWIAQLGQQRSAPAEIPEGNIFHPNMVVAQGSYFALLLGDLARPWRNLAPAGPVVPLYASTLDRLRAARNAATAAGSPALPFLSQTDIDGLPTGRLALPERSLAVTSKTPFDVSRYSVTPSVAALTTAINAATTAKNYEAVKLLTDLLVEVRTVGGLANNYATSYETMRLAAQRGVDQIMLESRWSQ